MCETLNWKVGPITTPLQEYYGYMIEFENKWVCLYCVLTWFWVPVVQVTLQQSTENLLQIPPAQMNRMRSATKHAVSRSTHSELHIQLAMNTELVL